MSAKAPYQQGSHFGYWRWVESGYVNPYLPGTAAHKDWARGYEDGVWEAKSSRW